MKRHVICSDGSIMQVGSVDEMEEFVTSAVGGEGPMGPAGPQGPQGEAGAQGIQGIQGSAGPEGPVGPEGAMGPTGSMGPEGPVGAEGPQGTQGIQGIQGETGAQGAQGDVGAQGPQGIQGNPGPNEVTTATDTTVAGLLKGAAGKVAQAVSGTDYASASHPHAEADVTNLVTDLAGKAAASHGHVEADITNLVTDLAGKAATSHQHAATDVNSGTLDGDRLPALSATKKGGAPATGTPSGKYLKDDGTWATPAGGGGVPLLTRYFAMPILANLAWTNMPSALSFWLLTATTAAHIEKIDLTNYTQCRLKVHKLATAGAAASKLILKYYTAFSQTASQYLNIGTSEVSVAVNVQNSYLDSGWMDLAAGAKADVFVALFGSGGDGALDPVFGKILVEFK